MPLISVIMGVYYYRDSIEPLRNAVCSILAQSEGDFEFLICDDYSNQAALQFLSEMAENDSRIKLVRPGGKRSLPEKLNACLKLAEGRFIARMDDDDVCHLTRFEKQIAYLNTHPETAFAGCNVNVCRDGRRIGVRLLPEHPEVKDFYMTQPYIHPTLIFRREALLAVGGYSEEKHCLLCEDYDLLLRLYAADYSGSNMQEILFDYTIPLTAKGNRRMSHRWNETVTRWHRFRELKQLPRALPYVVKPLAVGLLPEGLLKRLKKGL